MMSEPVGPLTVCVQGLDGFTDLFTGGALLRTAVMDWFCSPS